MLRTAQFSLDLLRLAPGVSSAAKWRAKLRQKHTRRQLLRAALVLSNVLLLAGVIAIVALNPSRSGGMPPPVVSAAGIQTAQPVDALASVDIAVTVAQMTGMVYGQAVVNQADSAQIQLAVASTSSEVVNKPQVVSSTFVSNKDIQSYVAQSGDTLASIASKFGVSSQSIMWSNSLLSDQVQAGKKLLIPPVNGIVYTVKAGDTTSSLASKFQSNEAKLIAYNDAEVGGIKVGEQIIIPDGKIVTPTYYSGYSSGFAFGFNAIYGYNGYDFGNCTWYVASQIAVPANWGNAATWAAGARAAGWHVSSTPAVGAIAQNSWMAGGLGHVAIIDAVSPDGKQVLIRDMNGIAGFDRVGVAWEPTGDYTNYITR